MASPAVKHIALKAFDLSCESPLLMLDINAALEGDIEQNFEPYDYDTNQAVFRTLCERFQIELSEALDTAPVR